MARAPRLGGASLALSLSLVTATPVRPAGALCMRDLLSGRTSSWGIPTHPRLTDARARRPR